MSIEQQPLDTTQSFSDHEYMPYDEPFVIRPWQRLRVQLVPQGESMTDTSQQDATDINSIVERFHRTGQMPPGKQGQYGDVSDLNRDFGELVNEAAFKAASAQEFIDNYPPPSTDQPKGAGGETPEKTGAGDGTSP